MKSRFLIILFLFPGFTILAQEKLDSILNILNERGEVYVSMESDRYKSTYEASYLPGFDRMINEAPFLYLTKKDSLFIFQHLNEISIHTAPSMLQDVKMALSREEVLQGIAYSSYPLYLEIMQYFSDNWPDICTIDTIGYTINGKLMLAAHLRKNIDQNPLRPAFFYSSSMHGNEPLGYSFMLMLINEILINNMNPEINNLLENVNIYINPLENPDGAYFTSDLTVFGATRNNSNGVDLNRNYPNQVEGDHPDFNSWQPETIAMMDYLKKIKPNMSANFHSGAEVVNYPWDSYKSYIKLHPDNDWLRFVSAEYADTARAKQLGYMSEFPGGITYGGDWYVVWGSRQDYVTYYLKGREVTIELWYDRVNPQNLITPESQISDLYETNMRSLINYMHQAKYGLQGFVTDSATGLPLHAKIEILNYDDQSSWIFSDENTGFFVRYLKEGLYDIEISADGYQLYTLKDLSINDYNTFFVNVKLQLIEDPQPPLHREIMVEGLFNESLKLQIKNPGNQGMQLRIYDLDGKLLFAKSYNLEVGINDIQLYPNLSTGIYILKLLFPDDENGYKIFKY